MVLNRCWIKWNNSNKYVQKQIYNIIKYRCIFQSQVVLIKIEFQNTKKKRKIKYLTCYFNFFYLIKKRIINDSRLNYYIIKILFTNIIRNFHLHFSFVIFISTIIFSDILVLVTDRAKQFFRNHNSINIVN